MLTINRVEASGTCVFCSKEKEVAAVVMDGQKEVLLCWADIKKHAQMRMRMNGQTEKKSPTPPVSEVVAAK